MTAEDEEAKMERRVAMEGRFVRMESQIDRLVSDIESEKGTRQRIAEDLKKSFKEVDRRLTMVEHKLYWASGIISALIFISHFIFKG